MSQPTQSQFGAPYPGGPEGFVPQAQPRNGLGTAGLVLGIIGLVVAVIPLLFWLGGFLGLLALIFGLVGLGRAKRAQATNKGIALAGTILGGVAIAAGIAMGVVTVLAVDKAVDEINKSVESVATEDAKNQEPADAATDAAADTGEEPIAEGEILAGGDAVIYDDKLTVTVSEPKAYTPSEFAIGHTKGNKAYQVTVVIENAGKEKFDSTLVTADARAGEDGVEAEQIFDDKVGSGFDGNIAPGKKVTVTYAFDAPAAAKTLTVEVSPGIMHDATQWELKL
ncbi:DUF4190 domain-containing protein [Streptomyces zhihengii]|uniref:DUF4190 and DUF4352 domain-containing protein n=1 Tax=Streptomyces zhihengii TaxID=1818004 RepID=A0ABS2UUG3_9ACTN|nr:DUF4190 domain-containing protein [Streptomyces zhihengii]MBM9621144.1 DUF4190 and DUF4352 domain-containing protein [Streptomyces zhihengii]